MSAPERRRLDESSPEWIVARVDPLRGLVKHSHHDEELFTLPLARLLWVRMRRDEPDNDWQLLHHHTLVTPTEHEDWLNGAGKAWAESANGAAGAR